MAVTNLDMNVVRDQIDLMADLYEVTSEQEINQGLDPKDYPFFTMEGMYFLWEFYTAAVNELIFTTISGVVAISIIGFLLIPHWTSILFITPLIMVIYVNLLGTLFS